MKGFYIDPTSIEFISPLYYADGEVYFRVIFKSGENQYFSKEDMSSYSSKEEEIKDLHTKLVNLCNNN